MKSKARSKLDLTVQSGFSRRAYVIDGHHHLVGRLASVVAKLLLNGDSVSVLRCEDLNYSGTERRHRLQFLGFLHKRCNVNPQRGPFHFRSPAKMFQRTVRGMLPIKTKRGKLAYRRLKTFEGVPQGFTTRKRMMVPEALKALRLKQGKRFCSLGVVSHQVGWHYQDVVATLEAKRKVKGTLYAKKVKQQMRAKKDAKMEVFKTNPDFKRVQKALHQYGY